MSSEYSSLNMHTFSQHENSSTFEKIDGEDHNGDVSSGYCSMKIHIGLQ